MVQQPQIIVEAPSEAADVEEEHDVDSLCEEEVVGVVESLSAEDVEPPKEIETAAAVVVVEPPLQNDQQPEDEEEPPPDYEPLCRREAAEKDVNPNETDVEAKVEEETKPPIVLPPMEVRSELKIVHLGALLKSWLRTTTVQ